MHRTQLPCKNLFSLTAYNLQGQTIPSLILDLANPPYMKAVLRSLQLIFPKQFYSSCSFFSLSLSSTQHGCISKDDYWIACRVLLSRFRSLDDFLIIRMPDRTALSKPRPQYLRSAYNNFQRCEQ